MTSALIPLRAGPLTLIFDPAIGAVRYVRLGDREIVRSVYGAVRDRAWNTIAPQISGILQTEDADGTTLVYDAHVLDGDVDFVWAGRIRCGHDGTIHIAFDGEARTTFWRNRIGLCVLHPVEGCAGQPCSATTTSGAVVHGQFPALVAPHQSFIDIATLEYDAGPVEQASAPVAEGPSPVVAASSCRVRLVFDGDSFEMEDQRNWGDASFKTYSTPLSRPMPVEVTAGTRVHQSVTLSLAGAVPASAARPWLGEDAEPRTVTVHGVVQAIAPVGLCEPSHGQSLTDREAARLRALKLAHLRTEIRFAESDWQSAFARAEANARALQIPLQVALLVSDDHKRDAARLIEQVARREAPGRRDPNVSLWLVLEEHAHSTSQAVVDHLASQLADVSPGTPVAAGTAHNFAELNRHRDIAGEWWPSYALNPQSHLPDTLTLIENVGASADTVRTVRAFSPHPVVVGPVTLKPRRASDPAKSGGLPPTVDPRQSSQLVAGWTIGSLSALLPAEGVHSVTYFETTGWRGVIECDVPTETHAEFPSRPGTAFPTYHVFAALAGAMGVHPVKVSHPLEIAALGVVRPGGGLRVLVANLTPSPREIAVNGIPGASHIQVLDDETARLAAEDPERFAAAAGKTVTGTSLTVDLGPWAFARIDAAP